MNPLQRERSGEPRVLLGVTLVLLVASGIRPYDGLTWWLEVVPVLAAIPILVYTCRQYPLTLLVYRLLFIHGLIILLGAHYTYARVPPGYWMQEAFDLSRNNYDRLGHLAQGFIPAILAREILIRFSPLKRGGWLFFLVTAVCLSISVFYEFFEWWAALIVGGAADEFLALQGDIWDTQWDMFLAFIGALLAQLLLSRRHDRELEALFCSGPTAAPG